MNDFTLADKDFCRLVKSMPSNKFIQHIKLKGHGNSMSPFLKNQETLFIRPVTIESFIRTGDIIAVTDHKEEKIIVHRVINQKKNLFLVKGDNCKKNDGWFQKKRIIGIVTRKKKISGKIVGFGKWENYFIALLSKYGLLNHMILPFGRFVKKKMQKL